MSNTESKYIVGKFDKLSFEEYKKSMNKYFPLYQWKPNELETMYEQIKLPKRSSKNMSGYNFFAPFSLNIRPGNRIYVPTGVYVKMDNPWMLVTSPSINKHNLSVSMFIDKVRRSHKKREESEEPSEEPVEEPITDNEGHVILVLSIPILPSPNFYGAITKFGRDLRMSSSDVRFNSGDVFARATFLPYGITLNDEWDEDNEHVDETKVVKNFVWNEELYPGSTNPDLDGMTVVVMIIDDGNDINYTFASIEHEDIDDIDIENILNGNLNDETDSGDNNTEQPGTEPDIDLPENNGSESGDDSNDEENKKDENDDSDNEENGNDPDDDLKDDSNVDKDDNENDDINKDDDNDSDKDTTNNDGEDENTENNEDDNEKDDSTDEENKDDGNDDSDNEEIEIPDNSENENDEDVSGDNSDEDDDDDDNSDDEGNIAITDEDIMTMFDT